MATFVTGVAGIGSSGSHTTGNFSPNPSGSNTAVFGGVAATTVFAGGPPTIDDCRFGGSGGTALTQIGTDEPFLFGSANLGVFARAPGPSGTSNMFGDFDNGASVSEGGVIGVCYSGVDQTTPYSNLVQAAGSASGTTTVLSHVISGTASDAGKTCLAIFAVDMVSFDPQLFTQVTGFPIRAQGFNASGFLTLVAVEGTADGSGDCTIQVNANQGTSQDFYYAAIGFHINDAAGGGVSGTLARTNANDTSSASGTTTVTGTVARTNANDTSAASGTTTVTGTLARTNANDTCAASGTVGGAVTGTLARTNANDTSAASGTTTVTGSLARTNANDTSVATGTTTVTGTLARTNANDTLSASGVSGSPTGTVAYTNNNDSVAASGSTPGLTTSGAPGPAHRFIAYINGKRVVGSYWEIQRLVEEIAQEQAEKDVAKPKPAKKPRIVVQPGKPVEKSISENIPSISDTQGREIQAEIRNIYHIAYIRAKLRAEQDEEDTLMVLL